MKKIMLLVIVFGLFSSCEDESKVDIQTNHFMIGSWINPSYKDSIVVFEKSDSMKSGNYGITFKQSGEFIERKNSGWCGTPPIAYSDFKGSWEVKSSIVKVSVDYWGGKAYYIWEVVSVDSKKLTVIRRLEKLNQFIKF